MKSTKSFNTNQVNFQFGGKHHRNILSMDETLKYFVEVTALILLDNGMIMLFQIFRNKIDTETRFVIHNIIWVSFINLYISVYVPLKHIILSKRETLPSLWLDTEVATPTKFYIREQELVPRRDFEQTTMQKFSYLSDNQRKDPISQEGAKLKSLVSGTRYMKVKEYQKRP